MPIDPTNPRTSIDRKLVEYDDKMRSLDLWRMNIVPPEVGIFDEPKRCYELNNEWAKIVMGLVSWLADTPVWRDAGDEGYFAISEILKFMIGSDCFMFDVRQNPTQPCLLDFSIDGGENWTQFADITQCVTQSFLENSIIDALNTNTTIQNIIDQLVDGGTDNDLPPTPTVSEPDLLCDASYYMTDQIIAFIDQTITDAATITLEEFLTALLGLGGFEGSLLVLFWQLIVANSYPDLLTDVQAARDEVAQILYCNEMDKELTTLEIDASLTIGEEAQAAFIGAINAITDGKWSLWAFVGSQVDSGESCACGWLYDSDFLNQDDGWVGYQGTPPYDSVRAVWSLGNGWEETDAAEFSGFYSRKDDIVFNMSPTFVEYVSMTYDLTKGTYTSNLTAIAIIVTLDGGGTVVNTIAYNSTVNGSGQTFSLPVDDVVTSIRILVRASTSGIGIGSLTGTGQVTNVQVAGTGINPFV